jgi:hypothetical protein
MKKVIIFTNDIGGVSMCIPTGEMPIELVQHKDVAVESIIIDVSDLPTDKEFFNAWELIDGKVVVNSDKKSAIKKEQCVSKAKLLLSDTDWTQVSDVGLENFAEFTAYRKSLRQLVLNPVENPTFPNKPNPAW